MWTSGFFNSINGDRLYNANQMSGIFDGLITSGVYESIGNKLAVQPNSGMTIQIASGKGWFGGKWANNDSEYLLTLEEADVLLNRYCAVCVRTDLTNERKAEPYLKYSEFATNPIKPTMERTDTIKEFCLAYVYIPAKATEITYSQIEDTRGDSSLCGWVTGLIEQVDSETLWKQWEHQLSAFMAQQQVEILEWFNSLQNYLSEDMEAQMGMAIISLQRRVEKTEGYFDPLGWNSQDDGTYIQTVNVMHVLGKNECDIIVTPKAEWKDEYCSMKCEAIDYGLGTITFRCKNPVDLEIGFDVLLMRGIKAVTD